MMHKKKILVSALWFGLPFFCAIGYFEVTLFIAALIAGGLFYRFFLGDKASGRQVVWGGLWVSLVIGFFYGAKVYFEDPTNYFALGILPITGISAGLLGAPLAMGWGWCLARLKGPLARRGLIEAIG